MDSSVTGRTFAIGDIHGCDVALDVLLSKLELAADDTVVVLGDVVDRGPGTKQAVDRLLDVQRSSKLVLLMGNHEEMFLNAIRNGSVRRSWLAFGGQETLESYGGSDELIPVSHLDFLKSASDYFQTKTEIFVHANVEPGVPLDRQSTAWLHWAPLTGLERPHTSGKRIICGHTSQRSGLPAVLDGWVCIDTWVYGAGYLTCLNVDTNEVFQAQQNGRFRNGFTLDDIA